jgi:hypothetical protein
MNALNSMIDALIGGVGRLPEEQRADAFCAILSEMTAAMTDYDVASVRALLLARHGQAPDMIEPALDLLDGHLALRALERRAVAPEPCLAGCRDDEP